RLGGDPPGPPLTPPRRTRGRSGDPADDGAAAGEGVGGSVQRHDPGVGRLPIVVWRTLTAEGDRAAARAPDRRGVRPALAALELTRAGAVRLAHPEAVGRVAAEAGEGDPIAGRRPGRELVG